MEAPAPVASAAAADPPAAIVLNRRRVVTLRAPLLGDSPAERAALAERAIEAALAQGGPGRVTFSRAGDAVRFELDGATVFFLVVDDMPGPRPALALDAAAGEVQRRLGIAAREARELTDPRRIAIGLATAAAATLVALLLVRGLLALRRRTLVALERRVEGWRQHGHGRPLGGYAEHARMALQLLVNGSAWGLAALLLDAWLTFVLHQFAYTRPWGERSTAWLLGVLEQFALAIASAVPGLVTAVLIFVIARLVARANALLLLRIERGEARLGWLDADTAGPTRRISSVVIWLFALAMAYPYLPGANSEAFKGLSVLAGVMLSLGASSVVGQALAGLSLMYARCLRVGEYVRIGDTEGTVVAVGVLATKLHTGTGEEVSLPSATIAGQPVHNLSRLVNGGRYMLQAPVTIGYATPWRQVHAMLLEAARRTPGVLAAPAPYVLQTALSDFYVEYRLCAQAGTLAPRSRAETMNHLHGHIQDVFNEHGVQIMSPHYLADPPQPQVVAREDWYAPPAARADGG
ncbi:MAG: mechanosensitive ion channel [Piscinibacter sp.]|nr:mechanosensitive ion channel [Piscinibacter sp.]